MTKPDAANDWRKDWESLGKQYWNAWTQAASSAGAGGDSHTWHEGLEQWSRLFAPKADSQSEVVERMMQGTQQFLRMVQGAVPGAAKMGDGMDAAKAFTDALSKTMGGQSLLNNPALEAIRASVGEGAMGFEQLAAQVHGAAGPIRQEVGALLSLPTFGYAREHQERAKLLASAMVEYEEQLAHYNAQMMKASQKGLEKLEDKLAERSEPGRELGSLRAVYDLWIDAAEEGYSEVVLADDFRKVYGDLVNSQMRVRKLIQDEIERMAISVGMPSRTELNAVHRRLAEMRRRLAALEEVHGSASAAAKPAARAAASAATKRPDSKAAKKRAVKPPRRAPARPARAAVGKQPAKVATFAAKLAKTRGKAGKSVARKGGK